MKVWEQVSHILGVKSLVSATIRGTVPLHVERYFIHLVQRKIPPIPMMMLACHLGGARVSEGSGGGGALEFIPSQSGILPANCPTEWMFSGAVDIALFYFIDVNGTYAARLQQLVGKATQLYPFTDPLVSAIAQQIVDDLSLGPKSDRDYVERLSQLMIEQCCRVVDGTQGERIRPDTNQLGRIEVVLEWVQKNLTEDLSCAELSRRAGISESHFRRVFSDAMGTSPHRFILRLRLERVRELLIRTDLSIARIATECGFKSQSHMTSCFNLAYGVTPARVKQLAKISVMSEKYRHVLNV